MGSKSQDCVLRGEYVVVRKLVKQIGEKNINIFQCGRTGNKD